MPRKKNGETTTEQISVTLPSQSVKLLEKLVSLGLHGSSRGEVARALILSRLEQLFADSLITG